MTKLRTSRKRFTNRGKNAGSTVISFRLSKPAPLVLTISGPGPGCAYVARGELTGRSGLNRFRFDGTVSGGKLNRGTYLLEFTLRDGTLLARTFVTIFEPAAPTARFLPPQCDDDSLTISVRPPFGAIPGLREPSPSASSARPGASSAPERPAPKEDPQKSDAVSQVLGEATKGAIGLPLAGSTGDGAAESGGLLERVLMGISLAALLALLVGLFSSLRRGRPLA